MPKQPLLTTKRDIASRRREAVARLRAKGLTIHQIVDELPKLDPPILNAQGEQFGYMAVYHDLEQLRREWRARASAAVDEHISQQLASLDEVEKQGWERGNLEVVLKAIALKMKLLGTDAPIKTEDWTTKDWKAYAREYGLKEEEVIAEAQRIITSRSGSGSVAETERDPNEAE